MIVSKNRKGSLLIEAVFALCIAATLLVPLFNSLATLIQHIGFNNQKIDAFFNAKHFLQTVEYQKNISDQSDQKETPQATQTQKLDNGTILTYSEQPVHKKSIFNNPYLAHVTVSYTWKSAFKDGFDTLTTYIVQIPKEKA
jgi:hypothetical protein